MLMYVCVCVCACVCALLSSLLMTCTLPSVDALCPALLHFDAPIPVGVHGVICDLVCVRVYVCLQIFAASGQQIRGINKKGAEFFKVITNLTEVIRNVEIDDKTIWTST